MTPFQAAASGYASAALVVDRVGMAFSMAEDILTREGGRFRSECNIPCRGLRVPWFRLQTDGQAIVTGTLQIHGQMASLRLNAHRWTETHQRQLADKSSVWPGLAALIAAMARRAAGMPEAQKEVRKAETGADRSAPVPQLAESGSHPPLRGEGTMPPADPPRKMEGSDGR